MEMNQRETQFTLFGAIVLLITFLIVDVLEGKGVNLQFIICGIVFAALAILINFSKEEVKG